MTNLEKAKYLYKERERQQALFGEYDLGGEPGWNILLDLFISHFQHKRIQITSACIASLAPTTTGLRWIGKLESHGLISRQNGEDKRVVFVEITSKGRDVMNRYLDGCLNSKRLFLTDEPPPIMSAHQLYGFNLPKKSFVIVGDMRISANGPDIVVFEDGSSIVVLADQVSAAHSEYGVKATITYEDTYFRLDDMVVIWTTEAEKRVYLERYKLN